MADGPAANRCQAAHLGRTALLLVTAAITGWAAVTNQGGAVVGSSLGGLVIGAASYPGLAIMTLLGGTIAASLALPLTRRTTPR